GLPDDLAGLLVEGGDPSAFPAGERVDEIPVDEWRRGQTVGHLLAAEFVQQVDGPDDVPLGGIEAGERATWGIDVDGVAFDGRRGTWAVAEAVLIRLGNLRFPELRSLDRIEREHVLAAVVLHLRDRSSLRDGNRRITVAPGVFPELLRALLRPLRQ